MANSFVLNVRNGFDLGMFCQNVAQFYQTQGFVVNVGMFGPGNAQITFDKNTGGINTILGLGIGLKANIMYNGNALSVSFTDAEWTGKIIGIVVGPYLCLIPIVTAIVGIIKQSDFPKQLQNDMTMIASNM